jgi:RecA/RadA recombinase
MVKKEKTKLERLAITNLPAVGPLYKKKFEKYGVNTVYDVVFYGSEELHVATGMKKDSTDELVKKANTYLVNEGFAPKPDMTPREMLEFNKNAKRISSGSIMLDEILKGGIETGKTTIIYGSNGSGKTQLSHTMAVTFLEDNPEEKVFWIEIEGTFKPERIVEIAIARGLAKDENEAYDKFLDRIIIQRCNDTTMMVEYAEHMTTELITENVGFIVIDGAIGKFRLDFRGRGTLSDRQVDVGSFVNRLGKISYYMGIAVLVTNQVTANLSGFGALDLPIGGHIVGHWSNLTLRIIKSGDDRRVEIKKSSYLPEVETTVCITDKGITDTRANLKERAMAEREDLQSNEEGLKDKSLLLENPDSGSLTSKTYGGGTVN